MKRRNFLRGAGGLALAMPALPSLLSKQARAQAQAQRRFIVFFTCNGVNKGFEHEDLTYSWWPTKGSGTLTAADLAPPADGPLRISLAPLAPHASKLLIPRGLTNVPDSFSGDNHCRGMSTALTAQHNTCSNMQFPPGSSIDQVIADAVNPPDVPSLTLGVQANAGNVLNYISYRNGDKTDTLNDPAEVFEDVVAGLPAPGTGGGGGDPSTPDPRLRLFNRRKSILDLVGRHEFDEVFGKRLSQRDREKLEQHYALVRRVERQLEELQTPGPIPDPAAPVCGVPNGLEESILDANDSFPVVGRLQMDLLTLAIACGQTNVATLQWSRGSGGPRFTFDNLNHANNHHQYSHRSTSDVGGDTNGNNNADHFSDLRLVEIDNFYARQYAYLLSSLDAYEEEGGTVLDHSVVVWANEMSDGVNHSHTDMPYVIAGGLDGYLKRGQIVQTAGDPHNQMWTTIARGMGLSINDFGACGNGCGNVRQQGESGELAAIKA
jgi:hypothetical protein